MLPQRLNSRLFDDDRNVDVFLLPAGMFFRLMGVVAVSVFLPRQPRSRALACLDRCNEVTKVLELLRVREAVEYFRIENRRTLYWLALHAVLISHKSSGQKSSNHYTTTRVLPRAVV